MTISVDGKQVNDNKSEKLLGVILNEKLTWQEHLHGIKWRKEGENSPLLIPRLPSRFGILKKLSRSASKRNLSILTNYLFYCKLSYCFLSSPTHGG